MENNKYTEPNLRFATVGGGKNAQPLASKDDCSINNVEKSVPKLRFSEFEGEWEKISLKDSAFLILAGGDIDKTILKQKGRYPVIANALSGDGVVGYYDEYFRIKGPAVTVTGRGEIGYAQARYYNFTPVVRLLSIQSNHNADFIANAINLCSVAQESTGVPQLTTEKLKEYVFLIPTFHEQQKIASYFTSLDQQIKAVTKRVASLKQVKAACLQSMFPQEGETVPKVRFQGFEGEWKEKNLVELGVFKSNGVDKKIYPNEEIINLLNYLDVYNFKKINLENYKSLMQVSASAQQIKDCNILRGDVFFTPTSETAEDIGHVMVIEDDLPMTCYSYHLMRFRPFPNQLYITFPNYIFQIQNVRRQMYIQAKGVQRFVLGKPDFESLIIPLPSLSEQQKIATFFTTLDKQIDLETQRLEKLKQVKKACLDKMFV